MREKLFRRKWWFLLETYICGAWRGGTLTSLRSISQGCWTTHCRCRVLNASGSFWLIYSRWPSLPPDWQSSPHSITVDSQILMQRSQMPFFRIGHGWRALWGLIKWVLSPNSNPGGQPGPSSGSSLEISTVVPSTLESVDRLSPANSGLTSGNDQSSSLTCLTNGISLADICKLQAFRGSYEIIYSGAIKLITSRLTLPQMVWLVS